MRTFRIYAHTTAPTFAPIDLRREAAEQPARWYSIGIANGDKWEPEAAFAVLLPEEGRIGIAWGADATWADTIATADAEESVNEAIDCWLNRPEEWEARN